MHKNFILEKTFFGHYATVPQKLLIRGGKEVIVQVGSARLYVDAHQKKRFVIGIKYQDESEYRYLIASDLSWRTQDIIQAYTYRWLVFEDKVFLQKKLYPRMVFFEDWKLYEGWGQLAKQRSRIKFFCKKNFILDHYEGSSRSLILSLLLDHCLLLHPEQRTRLENKQPATTVGSLHQRIQVESLLAFLRRLLTVENPIEKLEQLSQTITEVFQLAPSNKHMNHRELGNTSPSESLKYKGQTALA